MRLIATRDSCITRGSEALRNRMCDLNKYISLNICNDSSLLLSSNIRCHQSLLLSSSSSSSLLSHLLASQKGWRNRILKSHVKNVVHSHIDFYTGDMCIRHNSIWRTFALPRRLFYLTLVYIYISNNETLYLRYTTTFDRVTFMRFPLMWLKNFSKIEDT